MQPDLVGDVPADGGGGLGEPDDHQSAFQSKSFYNSLVLWAAVGTAQVVPVARSFRAHRIQDVRGGSWASRAGASCQSQAEAKPL